VAIIRAAQKECIHISVVSVNDPNPNDKPIDLIILDDIDADPIPKPLLAEPMDIKLVDPYIGIDKDIYIPKSRRQRKTWQRPYKYHQ
jgi:hypothetical protein